jgi:hypothetical protein
LKLRRPYREVAWREQGQAGQGNHSGQQQLLLLFWEASSINLANSTAYTTQDSSLQTKGKQVMPLCCESKSKRADKRIQYVTLKHHVAASAPDQGSKHKARVVLLEQG